MFILKEEMLKAIYSFPKSVDTAGGGRAEEVGRALSL